MSKTIALVIGLVFLVIGVLGLIPNPIIGDNSYFQADMGHTIIHLITGLIFLIIISKAPFLSSMAMKVFGVVYLIIAILGFYVGDGELLGFIGTNTHDNWLHIILGIIIFIAGLTANDHSVQM